MTEPGEYQPPRRAFFVIGILFLLITAVGVFTVLIPEIQDDPGDSDPEETPLVEPNAPAE